MSAVIYLATAAERLREFFVAAAFRQTQAEYRKRGNSYRDEARTKYATPFLEALDSFASPDSSSPLERLHAMAPTIQTIRDKRNELVHELATSMGRREHQRLSGRQPQPTDPENVNFAELRAAITAMKDERAEKIGTATKELADWYMLLMRASNEAFIFERRRRHDNT